MTDESVKRRFEAAAARIQKLSKAQSATYVGEAASIAYSFAAIVVEEAIRECWPQRPSGFKPWPEGLPKRYLTGTACDMLVGPCACGATHMSEK